MSLKSEEARSIIAKVPERLIFAPRRNGDPTSWTPDDSPVSNGSSPRTPRGSQGFIRRGRYSVTLANVVSATIGFAAMRSSFQDSLAPERGRFGSWAGNERLGERRPNTPRTEFPNEAEGARRRQESGHRPLCAPTDISGERGQPTRRWWCARQKVVCGNLSRRRIA